MRPSIAAARYRASTSTGTRGSTPRTTRTCSIRAVADTTYCSYCARARCSNPGSRRAYWVRSYVSMCSPGWAVTWSQYVCSAALTVSRSVALGSTADITRET